MTDRELLELAAKAAEYTVRCVGDGRHGGNVVFYMEPSQIYWNPLTDDGDALRLAVMLGLKIEQRDGCIGVQWVDRRGNPEEWPDYLAVPINGDPYAATRRAIVRVAAEIGKTM